MSVRDEQGDCSEAETWRIEGPSRRRACQSSTQLWRGDVARTVRNVIPATTSPAPPTPSPNHSLRQILKLDALLHIRSKSYVGIQDRVVGVVWNEICAPPFYFVELPPKRTADSVASDSQVQCTAAKDQVSC